MEIEIHIDHPWHILGALVGTTAIVLFAISFIEPTGSGIGGSIISAQEEVINAESDARRAHQERRVLEQKEEILRYQLQVLEAAQNSIQGSQNAEIQAQLRESTRQLLDLLSDKRKAEEHLLSALQEIWDAELRGGRAGLHAGNGTVALYWPVEPQYGISAHFMDPEYESIFGLPHKAIDIPVEQGTIVNAAGDGVVEDVIDNGYGYNYVIIRHEGAATLYGHVSEFLVEKGQTVRSGDPIAYSGGRPGSLGAGGLSTGPHLHLETIVDGQHTDPLELLPRI